MAFFRDMEDLSLELLSLLGTNRAETQQRRPAGERQASGNRTQTGSGGVCFQPGAAGPPLHPPGVQSLLLSRPAEILAAEKEVAQSLLDAKDQAHRGGSELQQLEAEIQKAGEKDAQLKASLHQLTRELEELKEVEADLERQEKDVDEDTTVTIPSAVYVAQLYRRVSKIEWDYECEPGVIKGIHHGPGMAQPIHLDSSQLSQKFTSDYLWSLVDTAW
ncbi:kinetochore protein Spc24 [Tupaia chinensis]|uniref:kinetochore protein Spc24 n=1 Tax=Tupaia chinensis TaxID=246437 RepID=UPI000FFBAE09|nr:kinetochore protein Spc24 [Tupaia chinensis]